MNPVKNDSKDLPKSYDDDDSEENAYRILTNSDNYNRIMNSVYYELSKTEWSHTIEDSCKKILSEEQVKSVDDLIEKTLPVAIREMPDSVKQTLCRDIKELLEKSSN